MDTNFGTVNSDLIEAPLTMRSTFNGILAFHTLTDQERAEQANWYPCDVINEGYDSRTQIRSTLPELSFDGERIKAEYTVTDKPIETIRQ